MNEFGKNFRVQIFGESHGPFIGITIDGVPPGIEIKKDDFIIDIKRRKSGLSGTTKRVEDDNPILISGIFNNYSTGAPITIIFENKNQNSKDYDNLKYLPRPGHADFTAYKKYKGFNDYRGGGHLSGRLTLPLVAAGVIAKKIISPILVKAFIVEIYGHKININNINCESSKNYKEKKIYDINNIKSMDLNLYEELKEILEKGDSVGGIIKCIVSNISVGLGEPFFNSVESLLSHMIFSIPSVKGIEFGLGFGFSSRRGSEVNDEIINIKGKTKTNYNGGINGGISNGNEIVFRVVSKPASSISLEQSTINLKNGKKESIKINGRHDNIIIFRLPPVIEAATAIVMADFVMNEHK